MVGGGTRSGSRHRKEGEFGMTFRWHLGGKPIRENDKGGTSFVPAAPVKKLESQQLPRLLCANQK